jgi:abortive infection bacteriophage resistance protein
MSGVTSDVYTKSHLTFDEQLAKLKERGLTCSDDVNAVQLLRMVGYYRLSAYVYPFRLMLPAEQRCVSSPVQFRSDHLRPGTTIDHIERLWRFDRDLRLLILDGLETIEIGVRTQVAYVLGARHPFGHLDARQLDKDACAKALPRRRGTAFEDWMTRYDKLQHSARSEDFVRHHEAKYGRRLPIWVAVELLDFGALVRLFGLLQPKDQSKIARDLGVRGGPLLARWLPALNYLRNLAAHHGRVWNRTLTYSVGHFNPAQVDPTLSHAARSQPRDKIYLPLGLVAYLTKHIEPNTTWPARLCDLINGFPVETGLAPETDMGFPLAWATLPLWASLKQIPDGC